MEKKSPLSRTRTKEVLPSLKTRQQGDRDYNMLVFCHLRWGFVYQRPQHLISRLATGMKVLFVEEPIAFGPTDEGSFEMEVISENLHVLRPRAKDTLRIAEILKKHLPTTNIQIGWFYSAAFSDVLSEFKFEKVVYDCMDELSLFRGANPELVRQEKFLLSEASVVFTGGKSLYEAKASHHPNVHCFPSSVERNHFAKALDMVDLPEDIKEIRKPVIGYFGVIDERIDLELLSQVAILNPALNFVMIGPLAKIGQEDLPRQKNIHYLGMKTYNELPSYLAAFDVAMMPFALNDATKFISPTKTLEFMAAGKPIVSTPIKDVERDYKHCIALVRTPEEFSRAVHQMLVLPPEKIQEDYNEILNRTSWDITAEKMNELIRTEEKA